MWLSIHFDRSYGFNVIVIAKKIVRRPHACGSTTRAHGSGSPECPERPPHRGCQKVAEPNPGVGAQEDNGSCFGALELKCRWTHSDNARSKFNMFLIQKKI